MTETAPAPSPSFTLSLLGRFELKGPHGLVGLPNKKLAGLLAYLACTSPQPQHREKLSTLLWGSHFEAQAKQNLRQALFKLRHVLGQSALRSDGEFISLDVAVVGCDILQFQELVENGHHEALSAATDLYRGPLVDDIGVNEQGWSEWLAGERERLSELAVGAMVALGESELSRGRASHALLAGQRANALNSMREDAHRLIMRALSAAGRNAEALKYHQAVATMLKRELGTGPDAATNALAAELRKVQEQKTAPATAEIAAEQAGPTIGSDKPSVAVLPFQNRGGDTEQEYFADGVTADIITALSRFRELVVIAAGSSFAFRDKAMTSQQIAQQLGAQYLLSGHIRQAGNRIRVSAELTHTGSEAQVWSSRYDRPLVDIFDLQDDVSSSVAAVVAPVVRSAEIERARRKPPTDLSAYDLYLRGLHHLWGGTREGVIKAIDLLRQSLSLDQQRTATLAALAWGLVMAPPLGATTSPDAAAEAIGLARRAVEEDGEDAFAHAVYGFTLFGPAGDNDQGRIHASEATRLNPSSAFAWGVLGMIDSMGGAYANAVQCLHRSLVLSPEDRMLHLWMTGLTASYFALGQHEEGVTWARKSVRHNPSNGTGHRMLAANLVGVGRLEEAREVTRMRDATQKTTIRDLRAMRFFKQHETLERYLSAQQTAGVAD
ncbi:BTAD domain-containing putative transcriptional regulator [Bradyrhizobium sp. WSM1253]|uniref:BTAD domain-containing putative transcriptional regulator n=1 Tax=Bradyrhizobium sp. WSM1253 TaxID=319003 RepID=UPI00025D0D4A|nr:BTAD domain-containing putative transcriptional regulator [Bradyrhizobium sp. WSM1253]EIG63526.1 putative integral membrane protein [Bradyrhizobium sp. WSM1253]